ncbi:MAG: guanylate kinase [Planctomycetota bacterium]|nr:MAG: guanylate kinase [Planctomycetota bacterium]
MKQHRGRIVILSGPSGVGKTTITDALMDVVPVPLVRSVSATTRAPRPGERDGVDYHFLTPERFEQLRKQGQFLECFEVFGTGAWYGTLRSTVEQALAAGKWVLLVIDVQGGLEVMRQYPDAVGIFVEPSSWEELERRLRGRGTEDEETIRRRLDQARKELEAGKQYPYRVVNDRVERAVQEICRILENEQHKLEADSDVS